MASTETEQYLRLWTELTNLYIDGRLPDALKIVSDMEALAPRRRAFNAHLRSCLLCALGRDAEALAVMTEIVGEGKWWSEGQLNDPDLESIRKDRQFSSLSEEMAELESVVGQADRADPEMQVFNTPNKMSRATLIALHMYGITADETATPWKSATAAGATVIVVQSSQRDADGLPVWNKPEIVDRDVGIAVMEGKAVAGDQVPVVFGGASQGAGVAMRLALQGLLTQSPGFVAVVGTAEVASLESFLDAAAARGVRGVMIGGAEDRLSLGWQKSARDELIGRGIPIHFEEVPGVGHWYPDDFGQHLQRALDFLLSA